MLRQRILTALVLIALTVWALFAWPQPAFAAFLGVFILIGAWEWTALCGLRKLPGRLLYVALIGVSGGMLAISPALLIKSSSMWPVLAVIVLWWLWAFIEVLAYQDARRGFLASLPGKLLSGFFILLPAWLVPLMLRDLPHGTLPDGKWLTLYPMAIVLFADTGAYFAGHRWGRTKPAPHASPGKTWKVLPVVWPRVLVLALTAGTFSIGGLPVLNSRPGGAVVGHGIVSVFGDLFESAPNARPASGQRQHFPTWRRSWTASTRSPRRRRCSHMWLLWHTPAGCDAASANLVPRVFFPRPG